MPIRFAEPDGLKGNPHNSHSLGTLGYYDRDVLIGDRFRLDCGVGRVGCDAVYSDGYEKELSRLFTDSIG
jgi:hypothetical protein